ncbi:hypothetical protein E2C01_001355 [Portunus trituberculatus]|uniref:Uncharacterized protein n=1 Tax=Portunus trituberculatus TaxID=210409 RepID=A0A5B7CGH7_PORTR|nr:hypothetical protein [Portunus trituberculatus]
MVWRCRRVCMCVIPYELIAKVRSQSLGLCPLLAFYWMNQALH